MNFFNTGLIFIPEVFTLCDKDEGAVAGSWVQWILIYKFFESIEQVLDYL